MKTDPRIKEIEVFIDEIVETEEDKQIDAVLEILDGIDSYDNLSEEQIEKLLDLKGI